MSDLIDRQTAYEVLSDYYHHKTELQHKALREALDRVPSANLQPTCNKIATSCNQLATDCISRQDAITLMCRALHYNYEEGYAVTQMLALPTADIDLSDYSDRLWRKAYEQGKADAERKKGKWNCGDDMFEYAICSACKWDSGEAWEYAKKYFKYCPNCGADMRGEADALD